MLWIKRNLFLTFGGVIACGLLGFGLFYLLTNLQKNKDVEAALEEKKQALIRLYTLDPFPSSENIGTANDQKKKLRESIGKMQSFFSPIPHEKVKDQAFRTLLDNTIFEMQKRAEQTSVVLPHKNYAFSFEAQTKKLQYAQGSFPALPEQLAEIKAICNLLFDAKVNKLVNVQRYRVSTDDTAGSPDYHELKVERDAASGLASSPYIVDFLSFSPELATVLENFCKSKHGLVVKSILIDTAEPGPAGTPQPPQPPSPGVKPLPPPVRTNVIGLRAAPPVRPAAGAPAVGGELKTVLNEKLLKVSMLIQVVKVSP
jgi:hypothetical protein